MMSSLTINLPFFNSNSNSNSNPQFKSLSSSNLYLGHIRRLKLLRINSQPVDATPKLLSSSSSNSNSNSNSNSKSFWISSQLEAIPLPPAKSSSNSKSSAYSDMFNYSEPVVVPIADAEPKVLAIASFDPQPVVPVVLPMAGFGVFPPKLEPYPVWPENHFIQHNKLMLQPQPYFLSDKKNYSSTQNLLWKEHPNLYRHSSCFVGHGSYLLAGCCNNLVLVCFYDLGKQSPREALWNLITNELKFLPELDIPRPVLHHSRIIHTTIRSYGSGFDPVSKDYKVLRFVMLLYEDRSCSFFSEFMELYSLKTDSWKRLTNSNIGNAISFAVPSIHINGFYYWKSGTGHDPYALPTPIILSFDFASEKFSHIPEIMPSTTEVLDGYELVEFDGSLAALFHTKLGSRGSCTRSFFSFEIWVWSSTESSWSRRVPLIDVCSNITTVVGLFENDKLFLQNTKNELLLFDCATRELKNLGIHADPRKLWFPTKE